MEQEFNSWNELKKGINATSPLFENFPKKGEVWIVALGKNIGAEQEGTGANFTRPVLVVKKFNNDMFWCLPLSTKQKDINFYFNFTDPNNQNVAVILPQMKLLSIKRFQRKLYEFPWILFGKIKNHLRKFLK
jgi:mRNA interferase MazF